jgi:hypothetical protein
MLADLHLAEDAFALHLLLQRLQRLVDIVIANENLYQRTLSISGSRPGGACGRAGLISLGENISPASLASRREIDRPFTSPPPLWQAAHHAKSEFLQVLPDFVRGCLCSLGGTSDKA